MIKLVFGFMNFVGVCINFQDQNFVQIKDKTLEMKLTEICLASQSKCLFTKFQVCY